MKRIVIAGALALAAGGQALAADLPPPMAPPPRAPATYVPVPVPYYNWTGFYIGGNLGGAWAGGSYTDPFGNSFDSSGSSFKFLGGGQVGFNWEFGPGVVIGVEGMFDWLPDSNNTSNTVTLAGTGITPAPTGSITANNQWLTTVTGKLGYAWDRVLVYGKGGGAWVGSNSPSVTLNGTSTSVSNSSTNWGWTAGVGLEYAFWGGLSGRVEYDYIGLTNMNVTVPASSTILPGDTFTGSNRSIQMVTVGLNYKFGGW